MQKSSLSISLGNSIQMMILGLLVLGPTGVHVELCKRYQLALEPKVKLGTVVKDLQTAS
jgi:hypothetical protein